MAASSALSPWDVNTALTIGAMGLHGPIDIALTTAGRLVCPEDPEGNPVVHTLGPGRWLAVKVLAIAGAAVAWWIARSSRALILPLSVLVALGAALVLPNLVVVAACLL